MYTQSLSGADWLQPVGTDCTACSGSQVRQLTLSSKVLDLNDAFNTYNAQEQVLGDFLEAQKALFFAITTEGIKAELTTYKANLEQRIFEEVFGPDFYEIMCEAKWLKGKKLEKVLLSMKDKALITFGIAEEINGHQTKTAVDLYQWIEKTIGEIRALLSAIRKLTFKLPPESYAAVYEKQSKHIDMESILNFYNDKILNVGKLSFKNYLAFGTRAVADFINKGVLRFAYRPTTEEIAEVDFERVRRHLPPDYEFKDFFIQHCAIFKKMAAWKGRTLVIDTKSYGKYMCLHRSKLTPEELLEFYKLEKLVAMINEAIKCLPMTDNKADNEAETPKSAKVEPELAPVDRFVNRIKAIMMEAAKRNGERIVTKTRAWQGEYTFFVDGERIAKMMDDLRKNHEDKIVEFLEPYQRCDGVTVVAPFIGRLLDIEELRAKDLQKSDLDFAFAPYYNNGVTAVKKMSSRLDDDVNVLFGTLEGLLRRYPATVFS